MILAAGPATRMEEGFKLLLPLDGGTVVEGAVDAAWEAGLDPLVVVVGHQGTEVARAVRGFPVCIVHNPAYEGGQATSLARGIREVRLATRAAAAAILLADEPRILPDVIHRAMSAWRESPEAVVRVRYRDRPGHPVIVPRRYFRELEALTGDVGARRWLERREDMLREVELPLRGPVDVDTTDDYERLVE